MYFASRIQAGRMLANQITEKYVNTPCAVINTGSKQGITCPPGDTAYNVSKAGVKVLTEALAHSLRNEVGQRITAHLLIPGSTFTGMTRRSRNSGLPVAGSRICDFRRRTI